MRTILQWVFSVLNFFKSRIFAVGLLAALLSMTVYATSATINTVYIHDDEQDETILIHTAEDDINEILASEGITTEADDIIEFDGFENNVAEVYISRAFDVSITADGNTQTVSMVNGTVRDALKLAGVEMNNDDIINIPLSTFVEQGDEIMINRVEYRNTEVEEDIPFERVEKLTPLLRSGRSEILQSGRNGTLVKTYSERTIDGVVEEATLIAENITVRPVTQVALVGAKVPVSDLDFGYNIVNNAPTSYKKVIEGARATAYSAGNGAWGASGNDLFYGHVAVNPKVIPYNSKLYITSADGSFVYGYAIASDTGTALMQGIIDVDLYYETYRESQLNGVKNVNIYILE
ncbi:G5 domain-containing protein [Hydrogenoanaerobacterium sp.]|uniref:G5 domain-containing protein n=1 Tax=Hydrogenoanaerobacterium sp. TaxID=2953763 RepID=UPI00289DF887|nr:G5 domain-containing protein [Hydrogenoanaerobacterium sp.]